MSALISGDTDALLWSRFKSGQHAALREIYDRHVYSLYQYGRRFCDDTSLVEDAIHDLFVNIWEKRNTLGDTDTIIGYLCVALRRDLIKKVKQNQSTIHPSTDEIPEHFDWSIEDTLLSSEQQNADSVKIERAMAKLSARQREAIYLKFFEEMSYEDICNIMQLNYQSARNLIARAIIELRQSFVSFLILILILHIL
ncbi:MAG: sigma-70 family RNA polymerase sigma factor [Saprospiraceae bacterium]